MAVIETRMKEGSIETLHDLSVSEVNYFIRNGVHTVQELKERLSEFENKAPKMYQSARNALIKVNRREEIVIESDDYKRAVIVTKNIRVNAEIMEQSLYEVCKGLAEVKRDKLYKPMGYQTFENYCEVEIGVTRRQAYNFISIAENLSGDFVKSISQIGTTKLTLLSKLDEPTRQEITQNTDLESTSVKELKAKIKELEDNAKSDKELLESLNKSKIEMRESRNRAEEKARELEQQLQELKANPVQVTVEDTTRIQELEEQLQKADAEVKKSLEVLFDNSSLKRKNAKLEEKVRELESRPVEVAVEKDTEEINRLKREIDRTKAEYEKKLANIEPQKIADIRSIYRLLSRTLETALDDLCEFFDDYDQHPEIGRFKRELNSDLSSWIQDLEIRIGDIEK